MVDAPYNPPLNSVEGLPDVPGAVSGISQRPVLTPTIPGSNPAYNPGRPGVLPNYTGPAMSGSTTPPVIDASTLMSPLTNLHAGTAGASGDVSAARGAGMGGQADISAGASQVAAGTSAINIAEYQTLLDRKNADNKIYSLFGTTPGAPSNTVADLAHSIFADEALILSKRDKIRQDLSVGFLDNPVQWFMNQISVPFEMEDLNNDIGGRNDKLDILHRLANATQEFTTINASAAYTVDTSKLAGLNQIALGQAQERVGQSGLALGGLLNGTAAAGVNVAHTDYAAEATAAQFTQGVTEAQYNNVLKSRADARATEMGAVQLDIANMNSTIEKDKVDAIADLDRRVQTLATVTGVPLKNYAELTMMSEGKTKQALLELMSNPDIQHGGALSLIGPKQAIDLANNLHLPLAPGQDLIRQKLTKDTEGVLAGLGPTAKSLYTPEQLEIKINEGIKQKLQSEASNIPDANGYYSPPSLATALTLPGIKDTPLAAALAPLANPQTNIDGNYPTSANDVISSALTMVKTGVLTPAQAGEQVSNFYKTIIASNDLSHGYRLFAIPSPANNGKFNHSIPSESAIFGGYSNHNLASRPEMEAYFTRLMIKQNMATPPLQGIEGP